MERVWPCRAELQLNVRREKTPRRERDIEARASVRGGPRSRVHTAGADLMPTCLIRRVFLLSLLGSVS